MENINTALVAKSPKPNEQKSTNMTFDELYIQKDYKGAADYLLHNKQQFSSGIFYYNLGTVYSKMGDYPTARFHFEKAIKEGYINSSSLNNLHYVKSQLQVEDISTSTELPDQLMNTMLGIPPAAFFSFTLLMFLLGIVLLKSRKLIKKFSILLFVLLMIMPIMFSQFYIAKINHAIALKVMPIYEGPSKIFQEKGKVLAGSKIILGEFKDGWFYVKFPISLAGWVNKDQLGLY